jgi:Tol biopolymer transport system component
VFSSTRHNLMADIYAKAVDGTAVTQLTGDPASDVQPAFSPDDAQVAFASDRAGSWDIWVMNVDGGPPVQITSDPAEEVHPSWSPRGSQVVYSSLSSRGGQWELWIADTDGGSGKKFIGYGLFPTWSPEGDKILYQRARERGSNLFSIWTVTLVDGEPRYPTELASSAHEAFVLPAWSEDGRHIVFSSIDHTATDELALPSSVRRMDIWIMSADGRGKVRLTDGHTSNHAPVFSPDGRLFFTTNRAGFENIWSLFPGRSRDGIDKGGSLTGDPRKTGSSRHVESGGFPANDQEGNGL